MTNAWQSFQEGPWTQTLDVRDFIQKNVTPYDGDSSFLMPPSQKTRKLWAACQNLLQKEQENGGVLEVDTHIVTGINAHAPGYIDQNLEIIVGLQTDAPLKRAVNPYGRIRMTEQACQAYGYKLDPQIHNTFSRYRRTHNEGVFAAYTDEMKILRKAGVITGLPDAYGRGRIIGDYRRLPLYGADRLIAKKQADLSLLAKQQMSENTIRLREEIYNQIQALEELIAMANAYGYDVGRPAKCSQEAFQWLYFAYLAAVKEQNGAAMSLGRISTFLDIYIERDLKVKAISEAQAQELMDQLVIKLRFIRQLRTPEYNELFAGDPVWITEAIGGIGLDGRSLVTRSSFRILHSLSNLGPAPEPNLTILWSDRMPKPFKEYCARMSMSTSAIQYENDDLMRPRFGDDYGIACCVSAMTLGKQMQFFGARCNLPKLLLLAINGGRDETTGEQIAPAMAPLGPGKLDYGLVSERLDFYLDWLSRVYADTMNIIHFMHDKYAYESLQMAFHDSQVQRCMAFGVAGLSVITDSLSAIRFGTVHPVINESGLVTSYQASGHPPLYGNDDDRADQIAADLISSFSEKLNRQPIYRNATPTLSVLTITSNVVYGQKTGDTPDGRKAGEPFAPGANPMHGRDCHGALASLNSIAKIPYAHCLDGISCTFSVIPQALGRDDATRISNLAGVLDGYFSQKAHHININVLDRTTLEEAMDHPERFPHLTIRVSGYAVHFHKLSRLQQQEVLARTFHDAL